MNRQRTFLINEQEIAQTLMASDSEDDEDHMCLDDEDIAFLEQNDVSNSEMEIVIEDAVGALSPEKLTPTPKKKKNVPLKWKNRPEYATPEYVESEKDYVYGEVLKLTYNIGDDLPSVYEVFESVADLTKILHFITVETNRYAIQNGRQFVTTEKEIEAFLGISMAISIHKLPSYKDYWSTNPLLSVPFVANVMTRKRYEEIKQNLHFSNNENQPNRTDSNYDRAFKVRPIINHFNKAFCSALSATKSQAIDEHMIKFKGRNIMKQYMKAKPIKWGFKMWCRCDSQTGYLFECNIYTGRKDNAEIGLGESVVLELARTVCNLGVELYFDNFFNSINLLTKLKDMNIRGCGTIRSNRKNLPKFVSDKTMKRGDIQSFFSDGIAVVKWMDNRAVFLASNFIDPFEKTLVKRRVQGSAEKININCPLMVSSYNKGMGGVDLMDQRKVIYNIQCFESQTIICFFYLQVYYEYDRKSIRFYLRIFFDLFDLAITNSFIIYNKIRNQHGRASTTLFDFRTQLCTHLVNEYTGRQRPSYERQKRGRRQSNVIFKAVAPEHQMSREEKRQRCHNCAQKKRESKTNIKCVTCNLYFCFVNERDCFGEYHSK